MMNETNCITLKLDLELVRKIASHIEDHDLYEHIIEQCAGLPLEDCPIEEWSGHWPVIDAELNLTGDFTDADTGDWLNYNDQAMIAREDAEAADWDIDEPPGYASPRNDEND